MASPSLGLGNYTPRQAQGKLYAATSSANCTAGTPATKPHAVSSTSGATNYTYSYDCNGNLTQRNLGSLYTLTYDAENRLTGVSGRPWPRSCMMGMASG